METGKREAKKVMIMLRLKNYFTGLLILIFAQTCFAAMSSSLAIDGHVGAEVAAFPAYKSPNPSGNLTLSTVPAGATIIIATLYAHDWFQSSTPSAIFAGTPLGTTSAFASDISDGYLLEAYKWDVTTLVTGNGTYAASASGFNQNYGLSLVVIFSDPTLPLQRVVMNDGALQLSNESHDPDTEATMLSGFGTGSGNLWIYTQADEPSPFTDEQILFNGNVVGGPIDSNLGPIASLFNLPVTTVAGMNTAQIFSTGDWFGWHLAVLEGPHSIVSKIDDFNNGDCVGLGDEINYRIDYNYTDELNYFGFDDLAYFVQWWLQTNCNSNNDCNGTDTNKDDTVNFIDFALLADNWLKGEIINDVSIIDELPAEAEFISADSDGIYDRCSHTVRWNIGTLEPGESGSVTLKARVKCSETIGTITNYCKIKSGDQLLSTAYEDTPKCGASDPRPADNATDMPANTVLGWAPGPKADKHDVYLGTDEGSVAEANRSNPSDVLAGLNQDANIFDPCGLFEVDQRYYWRIDEVNDANIWKGCVWSFTTKSQPVEILGSWIQGTSHAEEPGTDRALLLMAHAEEAGAISLDSVTYGGQPMTKIIDVNIGTTARVYVAAYILDEAGIAAATSGNFAFGWSTTPDSNAYGSVFLQNVNQINPIGASARNGTTSSQIISTAPLATSNGDMVIDAATNSQTGGYTVLNGFTEALELTISSADAVEGYKLATGVNETPSVSHNNYLRQVLIGFVVQNIEIFIDCGEVRAAGYGLTSDLNGDCYVDYEDIEVIQDCWLSTDCIEPDNCGCADFEPMDGTVDLSDFSDFAVQWLWCNDPEDTNCTQNWP